MKWIALVYVTPLLSPLSLSKLVPDISSSFHPRSKITRGYVRECVCVYKRKKERGRKRERERAI